MKESAPQRRHFNKPIINANVWRTLGVVFIATMLFYSCQPSEESTRAPEVAAPETANPPSSPDGGTTSLSSYRYDQTPILPVDTQIIKSVPGAMNRSIPGVDDSSVTYCESVNGEAGKYNGIRDSQRYPLASLSKIFLSAYVLDKLGPNYTFENQWYFKKAGNEPGLYDVYFRANYDPVLNIEKMLYAMSKLNAKGIKKIRQLIIDETTRVYLSILLEPHVELTQVPVGIDQSVENLKIILNSARWGQQTAAAKANLTRYAQRRNLDLVLPQNFSVQQVNYVMAKNINTKEYTDVLKIKSAPLLKYLKDLNVNSNNYMADMLFNTLGGASEFRRFQQSRLNLSSEELQFYTGSGLAISAMGVRSDNRGNCVSVLKVLKFLNNLSQQLKFNLGQVLLTAGVDQGTYESTQAMAFNQSVVLKTGRLFDVVALNVAGLAQLKNGTLFFAYLAHGFDNSQESTYQNKRDAVLVNLLNYYPVVPYYQTSVIDGIFVD